MSAPKQPRGAGCEPARAERGTPAPVQTTGPAPRELPRLKWMDAFVAALKDGSTVKGAAKAAGIGVTTVYDGRLGRPWFQAECHAASHGRTRITEAPLPGSRAPGRPPNWRPRFLAALAETSNVTASAALAGVDAAMVYRTRRTEPDFAAKWQEALFEGYQHLELEVLGHLRSPEPERKLDVAAALRLLAAHRETVVRLKALAGEEDEQSVRDSIDTFLEDMRRRRLENEAILIETRASEEQAADVA